MKPYLVIDLDTLDDDEPHYAWEGSESSAKSRAYSFTNDAGCRIAVCKLIGYYGSPQPPKPEWNPM